MKRILSIIASLFLLSFNGTGWCENDPYTDTVASIQQLLPGSSSDVRKETYGYVRFNKCLMDYNVSGLYPVGTPYTKTFSNIDFSSFNPRASRVGADSSDYLLLYFNKPFTLIDGAIKRTSNTVVIDASSNERAQSLFRAFLQLGVICSTEAGP